MKTPTCTVALCLALGGLASGQARADTLSFDDLSDTTQWHTTAVPSGYGGLQWIGWNYYSWANDPYNARSGQTRLMHPTMWPPSTPSPNAIFSDGPVVPFVFDGVWMAGYSSDSTPKSVSVALYRGGNMVHQTAWLTPTATPTFLASGHSGAVDRIVVLGDVAFVTLDDLQLHAATNVPEPGTWGLMTFGLAWLLALWRQDRPMRTVPRRAHVLLVDGWLAKLRFRP